MDVPHSSRTDVARDDAATDDGGSRAISLDGWDIGTFDDLDWTPWGEGGKARAKILGADGYMVTLVRAEAGYGGTPHEHNRAKFFYLIDGEVRHQGRTMRKGDGYAAGEGTFDADFATDTGATYVVIFRL
ncbi:MAG: cupin domain-containing protein [Acidimicrobiales bacterium]